MTAPTPDAVRDALDRVFDPCSVSARVPLSILAMGLVTDVAVDDTGRANITIRTTSPMCMLVGNIIAAAETEVRKVAGVADVVVEVDRRPGWSEHAMTEAARRSLQARRARSRTEVPVKPREWERRAARRS